MQMKNDMEVPYAGQDASRGSIPYWGRCLDLARQIREAQDASASPSWGSADAAARRGR